MDYKDVELQMQKETAGKVNPFVRPFGTSSPIHKLHVEILSYLFECVAHLERLPGETATYEISGKVYVRPERHHQCCSPCECERGMNSQPPGFTVSLICRSWYNIAISTPSLWTNIIVTSSSCPPFYRIAKQLERSKDLLIDIQINLEYARDFPSSSIHSFCNLLLTKVDHWRSLEVRVHSGRLMHEVHNAIIRPGSPVPATRLTSIVLSCGSGYQRYLTKHALSEHFVLFGHLAPHLNTISLRGIGVNWNQGWISSAPDLTTLKIVTQELFPSWAEFAAILRGAPPLKALVVQNYDDTLDDPSWANPRLAGAIPIELLELEQLNICLPVTVVVQFLRRCHIPRLMKLKLRIHPILNRQPRDLDALITQLCAPLPHGRTCDSSGPSRTSRSLLGGAEHLSLEFARDFNPGHVDAMYSHMDRLISLSLHGVPVSSMFLNLLSTPTGQKSDVRLPRLKTLAILSLGGLHDWDMRHVFALAWHRKEMGVPLRALSFCGLTSDVPKECLSWCEENLEAFHFR